MDRVGPNTIHEQKSIDKGKHSIIQNAKSAKIVLIAGPNFPIFEFS